jgi:3-oxoacid CoA-transferase A subunit
MINKVVPTFDEAVADLSDGAILLIGGFAGPAECPSYLTAAVARKGARDLMVVGNAGAMGTSWGEYLRKVMPPGALDGFYTPTLLAEQGLVNRAILAFPAAMTHGVYTPFEKGIMEGRIELELVSQGTIAERCRAARAGIPAFYTPTGVGTIAAKGKEIREFDGRKYVLERAIKGDFSLIRAHKADRYGNLSYLNNSRTLNSTMAGASKVTIAEVDEVVEVGELDPDHIVTPGVYVQRLVIRPKLAKPWNEPM